MAPLVSVVTPFRNTAKYLPECIESVLGQTYSHFEYLLSDNGSTDGSLEIAEDYARRDPRIRVIRQPRNLSQVGHYNAALREISVRGEYCKIAQADDAILPECLELMVQAFEQSKTIGLVSSYYRKGDKVMGTDFPYPGPIFPGKEVVRLYLRTGLFVFGSPTVVMYRSAFVRETEEFYDEALLHEDTEKCVQILEKWDFAFVQRVLSFLRTGNESVSSRSLRFQPNALDYYIAVQRYASKFMESEEAAIRKRESKGLYYGVLADEGLKLRGRAFWRYHRDGLKTLGENLDFLYLGTLISKKLLASACHPVTTTRRFVRFLKDRIKHQN